MKLRSIITLFAGVSLVLTGASCKKYLDQQPTSLSTDQTSWKSQGDADASVGACYSLIRAALDAAVTHYAYGDLPTDEIQARLAGDGGYQDIMNVNWAVSIPAANNYDPRLKLRVFTPFYSAVAQSNRCLYFINQMPVAAFTGQDVPTQQAAKNSFLGEAYFTRAFNYFYMARVWGDVPLVTSYTADNAGAQPIARSPQAAVLARCIADLDSARQYLPWKNNASANRVVRADRGAVFALLAHIYAWQGDYANCSIACDSVINSGTYTLVAGANYPAIFLGQSSEGIFEIAQNTQSEGLVYNGTSIAGMTLMSPYVPNVTLPNWELENRIDSVVYNKDPSDLRYQKEFAVVPSGATSYTICLKYNNVKTIGTNTNYLEAENNIIIFRYADILLLKAEALAYQAAPDEAGALGFVNQVRARAGITTPLTGVTGPALLKLILDERGRELFLEGHRFYDLARYARKTGISLFPNILIGNFNQGEYYWPLDPSLFTLNPKLTQTPFWANKLR